MKALYISIFLSTFILSVYSQTDSTVVSLSSCVEAALNYNPLVKKAANDLSIANVNVKTVGSGFYPVVTTELSGGLSNEYNVDNDYSTDGFKVAASQTIWQMGKNRSLVKQADYAAKSANYSFEAAKQNLVLEVKISFYNYFLQSSFYQISIANVAKSQLLLDFARERYKVGIGRRSDVLKAESDLTEAEFERDSYKMTQNQSRNILAMLTGLPYSKLITPADPWDSTLMINTEYYTDSIYTKALALYPELQIVKNLTFIQEARIKETQADLYPRLSVNGGYNWNYNALTQQQKGWYSTLSLLWTIFNGNERRYRLQAEKIRSDVYLNQKLDVENALIKEIRNEILNIKNAENQIRTANSLMKTTTANLEVAIGEYQAGTGSMLELTVARTNDLNAQKRYYEGIVAFLMAIANLERLTGGAVYP